MSRPENKHFSVIDGADIFYREEQGWHVFTAPKVPGFFCVMHKEFERAKNDVPNVLRILRQMNGDERLAETA